MTGVPELPAELSTQVTAFAARLRLRQEFLIGPGEVQDALRALGAVNILDRREVQGALRAVLCASQGQVKVFDQEFNAFFRGRSGAPPLEMPRLPQVPTPAQAAQNSSAVTDEPPARAQDSRLSSPPEALDDPPEAAQGRGQVQQKAASGQGEGTGEGMTLRSRLSPHAGAGGEVQAGGDDLPELLRAASALLRAVELGRAHRLRPLPRGPKLDARRTLHAAARTAGDAVNLRWLGRPRRAPRFLLVLDGSRSMGREATLLLRFAQALHLRSRRVEVYAFSTGLQRLTPLLRRAAPGQTLRLPDLGDAWGGGTRIGENLLQLARAQRERVNRDTVVIILSDGLDTGDVQLVSRALRDLRRRSGLLLWLSPLAGLPGYQPVQRAIQAALPHLHALLPAASIHDLQALPGRLRRGGPRLLR